MASPCLKSSPSLGEKTSSYFLLCIKISTALQRWLLKIISKILLLLLLIILILWMYNSKRRNTFLGTAFLPHAIGCRHKGWALYHLQTLQLQEPQNFLNSHLLTSPSSLLSIIISEVTTIFKRNWPGCGWCLRDQLTSSHGLYSSRDSHLQHCHREDRKMPP